MTGGFGNLDLQICFVVSYIYHREMENTMIMRNIRIIDPSCGRDETGDIYITELNELVDIGG